MAHSHTRTFIVRRLDGAEQEVSVDKKAIGDELMDKVCFNSACVLHAIFGKPVLIVNSPVALV